MKLHVFLFAFAPLASVVVVACGGQSAGDRPLASTGGAAFDPVETVALEERVEDTRTGESHSVTRIVASDHAGLCDKLASGRPLVDGERVVTIDLREDASTPVKQIAKDSRDHTSSLVSEPDVCKQGKSPVRGDGTIEITAKTESGVSGVVDVRYEDGTHVQGRFEAQRCKAPPTLVRSCPAR